MKIIKFIHYYIIRKVLGKKKKKKAIKKLQKLGLIPDSLKDDCCKKYKKGKQKFCKKCPFLDLLKKVA